MQKSHSALSTDIFNCKMQVQSSALTFLRCQVSANSKFLICDYTFALMYKCRCRFEVFALKIFSDFSLQISILAICTYISEKKVITKLKILKCTYCPLQKSNGKTSNQQSALNPHHLSGMSMHSIINMTDIVPHLRRIGIL